MSDDRMMVFTGNANPELTEKIVDHLGISPGKIKAERFSDGEVHVEILENVRGRDVFIVQSTCAPTNDNLMELLIIADALYRASAGRITAVIPYYGYARQDRRVRSRRVPISAKLVADMIATGHVDRVLTIDLHSDQVQGFFDLPVDNVYASGVLIKDVLACELDNIMVVSPDVGGVVRARALAKGLGEVELAIIDKRRPEPNKSEIMNIIGNVEGRNCILIDDLIDTGGTLCNAATALKQHGALSVRAYATHAVFSGKAVSNIEHSQLDEVVITDTIPLSDAAKKCAKIRQLSVAGVLAKTILRINQDESVSSLFEGL
ncbi:ribose-phosphate pyrophosphokinase [Thiothrix subterranea]|uniref:Ribose-phosphate pyrophosphokinase n=2 Tax=Thiothrix subterranea TaxID=2735563 RepID=A0AA51MRM8_9GAMM|nr:ribose-phosphate pyrophosphokinase [Thiothrix subterranea]MDQ5767324.1 ribose-phosphate pyrophosphokinase [Thiothrix subterranea]WML88815.1 ribose-phosphate pyrophosphokinase [Thiothrix subterranea]